MNIESKIREYKREIIFGTVWGLLSWAIVLYDTTSNFRGPSGVFENPFGILIALPTYLPLRLVLVLSRISNFITMPIFMITIIPILPVAFGIAIVYLYKRASELIGIKRTLVANR